MEELFLTWFLIFVRAGALLSVFPIFSAAAVPVRLRIMLAGLLAFLVMPTVALPPDFPRSGLLDMTLVLMKEVSMGLLLGFLSRLVMFSASLAGHYVGNEIGLQLGGMISPGDTMPTEVPGVILQLLATMLLLAMDIHLAIIAGFQQSYSVLPIGGGVLSNGLFDLMTAKVARAFLVAVKIAAPILAVGVVLNLLMMILARAVPQMNVFAESFSIRVVVGLFLFGSVLSLASHELTGYLGSVPEDFLVVARWLGVGD